MKYLASLLLIVALASPAQAIDVWPCHWAFNYYPRNWEGITQPTWIPAYAGAAGTYIYVDGPTRGPLGPGEYRAWRAGNPY